MTPCAHALVATLLLPAEPGEWRIAYGGQSLSTYDVAAYAVR